MGEVKLIKLFSLFFSKKYSNLKRTINKDCVCSLAVSETSSEFNSDQSAFQVLKASAFYLNFLRNLWHCTYVITFI